jgi:2-amino-4-hydroxy-6-hydroxymethyldihydropteridine diphosphokinase
MHQVFLLLGSNLGDKRQYIEAALAEIEKVGKITSTSSLYETEAWGNTEQASFYNCTCGIETSLKAGDLLNTLLGIEKKLGRERGPEQFLPRVIDIDILFFDTAIIQTETLIVPHPRLHLRNFTLAPMNEIAPELVHPVLKKTIHELYTDCKDPLKVKKIS